MKTTKENNSDKGQRRKEKPVGQKHEQPSAEPQQRQDRQKFGDQQQISTDSRSKAPQKRGKEKRLGDESEITDETTI